MVKQISQQSRKNNCIIHKNSSVLIRATIFTVYIDSKWYARLLAEQMSRVSFIFFVASIRQAAKPLIFHYS